MPDISPQMQSALAENVIKPILIGRLDIEGDPVTVWDGPGIFAPVASGDSALDGQIFSNSAGLVSLSNISESDGIAGAVQISMFGIDIDDPLLRQVIRDKRVWRGRKAWIWLGLVDLNDPNRPIVYTPTRLKTGLMTNISVQRGDGEGIVIVSIDEDLARSENAPHRYADQRNFYQDDSGADFMHKLANSPQGLNGRSPVGAVGAVGSSHHGLSNRFVRFK